MDNKKRIMVFILSTFMILSNIFSGNLAYAKVWQEQENDIFFVENDLEKEIVYKENEGDMQTVQTENKSIEELEEEKNILANQKIEFNNKEILSDLNKTNETYRVIVELDGNSIIEEAIAKNIAYKDLEDSFVEDKKEELKLEQEEVLSAIKQSDIEADETEKRQYDTILNGLSLEVRKEDIQKIEEIEGVRGVYIADEYERPLLNSSKEMIGAGFAWDTLGYKGEGIVVAVIDSGIDYRHRALKLDNIGQAKLNQTKIENIIQEHHLSGRYYTKKVPYGYNYYDFNQNLLDSYGVMHGMHVSGIVAANDKEKGIFGVAPNAQILAMKVFSDDLQYPTTFTDVWLKALDDAITLQADVVNMSLGSAAGLSVEDRQYPEVEMLNKARKAGILVSVAGGNDASITKGNTYSVNPLEENYDTALIASPALHESTLAVASMENHKQKVNLIYWVNANGIQEKEVVKLYKSSGASREIRGEFIDLYKAEENDIKKEKIKNKIAMVEFISKGDLLKYAEKLERIAECEPLAIILYNNKEQGNYINNMIDIKGALSNYTVVRIKNTTYNKIIENSKAFPMKSMELIISNEIEEIDNINSGKISEFSSWGPTPDLRIKPEITSVGGNIYSTIEENQYKSMSGTSMAAPQVTAASAILKQYIKGKGIQVENEADFIKLLLMNTATPIINVESEGGTTPYFVRQQGSGAMQLDKALQTGVVVRATGSNDDIKDGKLELKELDEKKFTANLEFENFSDKENSYYIYATAMYELIENGYRTQKQGHLNSGQDNKKYEITIPAHSKKEIEMELDYSDADQLKEKNFLEGYITIKDANSISGVNLNIPFLGFYGDWDTQKAIDAFGVQEIDLETQNLQIRNTQFYVNKDENIKSSLFVTNKMLPLPILENVVYFSPNSIYHSNLMVRLAPLRNMESVEYSILEEETGEKLRVLGVSHNVRKLSRLGRNNSFRMMPDSIWDGRINGEIVEESKTYIYQIKAKLNTKDMEEQIYQYKVRVDHQAPSIIEDVQILDHQQNTRLKDIVFKVQDAESGIENIYIQSAKYDKNENGEDIGNTKYGKYTKINFVEEEVKDGKTLLKVEDSKLNIPVSEFPNIEDGNGEIYICVNGHRNKEIEIHCPYFVDTSHLHITAKDYLSNRKVVEKKTGVVENYNTIHFLNFYQGIKDNQASIFINEEKLEKGAYSTTDKKLDIRIEMPNRNKHISTFYIRHSRRQLDFILDRDKLNFDNREKYKFRYDEQSNSIYLTIERFRGDCEVSMTFTDGKMPKIKDIQDIQIDLSGVDISNFKEIRSNSEVLNISEQIPNFQTQVGRLKLNLIYKEDSNKNIEKIIIRQEGKEKVLRKEPYFSLLENKASGYASSPYSIHIFYDVEADTSIEIIYGQNTEGTGKNHSLATSSDAQNEDILDEHDEDKEISMDNIDDSQYKYPTIFITSPRLLDILTEQEVIENKILVKGFVGRIKNADAVQKIQLQLVDKNGNLIGQNVEILADELEKKAMVHKENGRTVYSGYAYHFEKEIEASTYNVNIRAEVFTKNGENASIVRRLFFDKEIPKINYTILDRNLSSENAKIHIVASDNSFKLQLYQGSSLIGSFDNTHRSMESTGSIIEQDMEVPLQLGQNEITIVAKDIANQSFEKKIYIYRIK